MPGVELIAYDPTFWGERLEREHEDDDSLGDMQPWDYEISQCGSNYFTHSNVLGMQGTKVFFCGNILCGNEWDILARKEKFLNTHLYLNPVFSNNKMHSEYYIIKADKNNFYTPDGVHQAFTDLDILADEYRNTKDIKWFRLFAGKTRMWFVIRLKDMDSEWTESRQKDLDALLDDYTNFSDITDEDARKLLMTGSEDGGYKRKRRVRAKGKYESGKKERYVFAVKKDNKFYALEQESTFEPKEECTDKPKAIAVKFDDPKLLYPTYDGDILTAKQFFKMVYEGEYFDEFKAYLGKKMIWEGSHTHIIIK